MLVISTCCNVCVRTDLGLWILHSDLGQPSQKVTVGRCEYVYKQPYCRRGQCSRSIMGKGTKWTTSHQHRQHTSNLSMFKFTIMGTWIIMYVLVHV
jgi:hypothetical protein